MIFVVAGSYSAARTFVRAYLPAGAAWTCLDRIDRICGHDAGLVILLGNPEGVNRQRLREHIALLEAVLDYTARHPNFEVLGIINPADALLGLRLEGVFDGPE